MAVSKINFLSLPVEDQDRAVEFYTKYLGFEVQLDAPYSEGWRWIFLNIPNADTRLHFAKTSEVQFNGVPALTLECDDVDQEAEKLKASGVTIVNGPDAAPWAPGVRWLMIKDTEGNLVLLESMAAK